MKEHKNKTIGITTGGITADAPDAPQNLTAVAVDSSRIDTVWDAVAGATRYNVYRSVTVPGPYELVGLTAEPSYTNTGLSPNTTYYYRVAAIVGGVESSPSAYAAATTYPAVPVPPTPTNVRVLALGCTEILVTWDASAGAEGYNVYRSESASGPYQLVGTTADTTHIDTGLSPSTPYYYFIQAYTGSQFSQQSSPGSTATSACGSPTPPCRPCCCPHCGCNPCCCPKGPRHTSYCQ